MLRDVSIIQAYSTYLPEGCSSFAKCVFQAYFGWWPSTPDDMVPCLKHFKTTFLWLGRSMTHGISMVGPGSSLPPEPCDSLPQVPKDDAVLQKGLPLRRLRRTLAVTLLPLVPWTKKPVQRWALEEPPDHGWEMLRRELLVLLCYMSILSAFTHDFTRLMFYDWQ